jgi:hypothetical protein
MAPSSNLFNTGMFAASVSFNRGAFVQLNAISPPRFMAQQGFPSPSWDPGGSSRGKIGPGTNEVQLQSSGSLLPVLTVDLPNVNPGSVQIYLIWSLDLVTLDAKLGVMFLDGGAIIVYSAVRGTASSLAT